MAIVVGDAFILARVGRLESRWCHMMSTRRDPDKARLELVNFAVSIGLRREWIQHQGAVTEHFDLTEGKRKLAVARGAREIDWRQSAQLMELKIAEREKS
jgi:hypothetical protein